MIYKDETKYNTNELDQIVKERWQKFQLFDVCPECNCNHYYIRRMAHTPRYPQHWRYTCATCKTQWYEPYGK